MALDALLASGTARVLSLVAGERGDAMSELPTASYLELGRALGDLSRVVDALGAQFCTEMTRRVQSDAGFRREALGGDVGGRFASELLRELTRLDDDTLRSWESVGEAMAPRMSLQGETLPPRHEPVAAAVADAAITAKHAAIVARGIERVADHADPDALRCLEQTLVDYAGTLTTRQLAKLVRQLPDRLDADGAEPREATLRKRSKITIRQLENGLTRIVAELHPVAAGLFTAAIDAHTAPRRAVAFAAMPDASDSDDATTEEATTDDRRPLAERRVDAFESIMRDALRHDTGSIAGTAVTMIVTVGLDELRSGLGSAHIAGIDEPISARTARLLAAEAELIPVVLGRESEVLDLGRSSRLFSESQRRAMVARDGGCVWPGCQAPPSWCEAAHVEPWLPHGRTDLANGVLLCSGHHHRFDRDGWSLRRDDGVPYLIPPPWLDPARTPRRAGRLPLVSAA